MTANADFPRGLWLTTQQVTGGSIASVTFPALPGLSWVLSEIHAIASTSVATSYSSLVTVTSGYIVGVIVLNSPAAGGAQAAWDWVGKITYPTNTAVAVEINTATNANMSAFLSAAAYPI